jgi:cytochrome c-type biogenesis protein CcmE
VNRTGKILLSVAVAGGALVALLWATVSSGAEYYKYVDEVAQDPDPWRGKRLQIHGHVAPGSIQRRKGTLDYRFTVERNGRSMIVEYSGIVPDTFKDQSEVVVKGRLRPDGGFQGTEVMAKCPSKYEAKPAAGVLGPR